MSYNPHNQFRCTIIRGKAQKEIEDYIPLYCNLISSICPCEVKEFEAVFNNEFSLHLYGRLFAEETKAHKKVIVNHRTEIAGKLYSLYYFEENHVIESPLCKLFIETGNIPALFKSLCLNFQFPNGSQKLQQTVKKNICAGLRLRPYHFILQLLEHARRKKVDLSAKDVGIYVLNSYDVLQGKVSPKEVLNYILRDRANNTLPYLLKGTSKDFQHIREQLNFLVLANLISINGGEKKITLNTSEPILKVFLNEPYNEIWEDVYTSYDAANDHVSPTLESAWMKYASTIRCKKQLLTQMSFEYVGGKELRTYSTQEIGDEGELVVVDYEKNRLVRLGIENPDVKWVGKKRGIGYDVESSKSSDECRYIEVKATTRITNPDIKSINWLIKFAITRNEFYAAERYKDKFYIYIVFLSARNKSLFVIQNPYKKFKDGTLELSAPKYDAKISAEHVDAKIILQ